MRRPRDYRIYAIFGRYSAPRSGTVTLRTKPGKARDHRPEPSEPRAGIALRRRLPRHASQSGSGSPAIRRASSTVARQSAPTRRGQPMGTRTAGSPSSVRPSSSSGASARWPCEASTAGVSLRGPAPVRMRRSSARTVSSRAHSTHAGDAGSRRAARAAACTTTTSCSAHAVAKTIALIASRSARRITNTGCTAGGYIRAWGKAPDGIHWELGIRRDAPPLLTLVGDRYVSDS